MQPWLLFGSGKATHMIQALQAMNAPVEMRALISVGRRSRVGFNTRFIMDLDKTLENLKASNVIPF